MLRYLLCLFLVSLTFLCGQEHTPKALILIVASDDYPIFKEHQKLWRRYMNSDPEHIKVYFIKANPNLLSKVEIVDDVIWCQTPDGYCEQNCGIIMKTLYALEHALSDDGYHFDYVLRTNLSTLCVFPRFLEYLKTLPTTGCYAGNTQIYGGGHFASGTGMIFSRDIVKLLVYQKNNILESLTLPCFEDVEIANFLRNHKIPLITHNSTLRITTPLEWEQVKNSLPTNLFQVSIKGIEMNKRVEHDLPILEELMSMFYPNL